MKLLSWFKPRTTYQDMFDLAEKVYSTRYFYCAYKYYLNSSNMGSINGATNTGNGMLVVQGRDPNPIDTIIQLKERHSEYELVIPIMFYEITKEMYDTYLEEVRSEYEV